MAAYKDKSTNSWYTSFYYENWKGERKRKLKRGFSTKKEALEWEREFQQQKSASLDMTFETFSEIYVKDMASRLKENTWQTKKNVIETKIIPAFGKKKMNEIRPSDIIQWQNEMMSKNQNSGKGYSSEYLKTVHNQLSAIFNHAVRFYELKSNPASKVGNMGKPKSGEMLFWTKDEYLKFADYTRTTSTSYYAFEMLYWCGIRLGELLALTSSDFDFIKGTVSINKSYQRIERKDVITTPKTEKSNRIIQMPDFLCQEIQDYMKTLYGYSSTDRLFQISKRYLQNEITRGAKKKDIKRIRIHDLRHSHVSHQYSSGNCKFYQTDVFSRVKDSLVGGTVIDFVVKYFNLTNIEAVQKLNDDFNLNLLFTKRHGCPNWTPMRENKNLVESFVAWEKRAFITVSSYFRTLKFLGEQIFINHIEYFEKYLPEVENIGFVENLLDLMISNIHDLKKQVEFYEAYGKVVEAIERKYKFTEYGFC